jgi:hypothetical protein
MTTLLPTHPIIGTGARHGSLAESTRAVAARAFTDGHAYIGDQPRADELREVGR